MKAVSCSTTDPVTLKPLVSDAHSHPPSSTQDSVPGLQLPLIALDIGMKRIGIAVCDRMAISCRGVTYLHRNDQGWPKQLLKLIKEYGSRGIIAGLPLNMDGSEGVQAKDARSAIKQLKQLSALPVAFQDERLSTWTAKERLYGQGLNEKKVKERIDQTAAAVILEDFLTSHPELK